jgi:GNAT superfamily N-acetyltransferase
MGQVIVGTILARAPQPQSKAPLYRDAYTWSFGQFAVAPELKGRGLGRDLHEAVLELACHSSAKVMALDTAAPALRLIALYESWGVDWRPRTNYPSVLMTRLIALPGPESK